MIFFAMKFDELFNSNCITKLIKGRNPTLLLRLNFGTHISNQLGFLDRIVLKPVRQLHNINISQIK